MDISTVCKLDQKTIGPNELALFVAVLRRLPTYVPSAQSADLTAAADKLDAALSSWCRSMAEHHTDWAKPSADVVDMPPAQAAVRPALTAALDAIEIHLSRLILRNSNFGLAWANDPSELDEFLPWDALIDIRVARPHVRRAMGGIARAA